jgi:hypothetical protein
MSNLKKSLRRDREIDRRKNGHQVDGRSLFIIKEIQRKRSEEIKRNRIQKQERFLETE